MQKLTVLSLAFITGFCIMSFELIGGRMLAPYFGNSVYVWGSIITVFMLALSLGYLVGGRYSLGQANLSKFAGLFLLASICMLPMIYSSEWVMDAVFSVVEDPRYGSLLAASVLFLLPTAVMGMIAPYSVRILTESTDSSGQTAGFLYFVSTLGSAIGTIVTSFYLVLWLEIDQVLWLSTGMMFAAGVFALLVALSKDKITQPIEV